MLGVFPVFKCITSATSTRKFLCFDIDRRPLKARARQYLKCAACAQLHFIYLIALFAAADANDLRIQRLAWAGIRLQLPHATAFIDPLINPDEWGTALGKIT